MDNGSGDVELTVISNKSRLSGVVERANNIYISSRLSHQLNIINSQDLIKSVENPSAAANWKRLWTNAEQDKFKSVNLLGRAEEIQTMSANIRQDFVNVSKELDDIYQQIQDLDKVTEEINLQTINIDNVMHVFEEKIASLQRDLDNCTQEQKDWLKDALKKLEELKNIKDDIEILGPKVKQFKEDFANQVEDTSDLLILASEQEDIRIPSEQSVDSVLECADKLYKRTQEFCEYQQIILDALDSISTILIDAFKGLVSAAKDMLKNINLLISSAHAIP